MRYAPRRAADAPAAESPPAELLELRATVRALPSEVRAQLEPIVDSVLEHARFRDRVLGLARDGLARLRLDLELARFDLEATRREHEALRDRMRGMVGG